MGVFKRFRDAITGRFVRKQTAEERPATTVSETVRMPETVGEVVKRKRARPSAPQ